uniref:Uncharacterized protein n=1 Tax=Steinernema glaseri TaxID=37863 RepID=A0A1I7ZN40_9BILA
MSLRVSQPAFSAAGTTFSTPQTQIMLLTYLRNISFGIQQQQQQYTIALEAMYRNASLFTARRQRRIFSKTSVIVAFNADRRSDLRPPCERTGLAPFVSFALKDFGKCMSK